MTVFRNETVSRLREDSFFSVAAAEVFEFAKWHVMVANRLITVAAGLAALCCPTWANASLCHRNDCRTGRCFRVPRGCDDRSACGANQRRAVLCDSVTGGSAHRCGRVFCGYPIDGSVNAFVLSGDQGQAVNLQCNLCSQSVFKKQVGQVKKSSVPSHNRRQACLGVWLK